MIHFVQHWCWRMLLACILLPLTACGSQPASYGSYPGDLSNSGIVEAPVGVTRDIVESFTKYDVVVEGGGVLNVVQPAAFDQPFDHTFRILNSGIFTDTYTITTSSRLGWASFAAVPAHVTLAPAQSVSFPVQITFPQPLDPTLEEKIVVTAQSTRFIDLSGSARLIIHDSQPLRPVRPVLECVADTGDGSYTAHFGYTSENADVLYIAPDADNYITPAPAYRNQPQTFYAGNHKREFSVVLDGNPPKWSLKGPEDEWYTATAARDSPACSSTTP